MKKATDENSSKEEVSGLETEQVQDDKKGLEEESPSLNPEEMQDLASNEEAIDENSSKEEISGLETEQVQDDKKGLEEESPSLNPEEMQALPVMKKLLTKILLKKRLVD